jgi:DNA-binding transcriptional LysR family regulator
VLLHAALASGGIALQPTYLASSYLASDALVAVLPEWQVPAMTVYALYPSRRHLPPAGAVPERAFSATQDCRSQVVCF